MTRTTCARSPAVPAVPVGAACRGRDGASCWRRRSCAVALTAPDPTSTVGHHGGPRGPRRHHHIDADQRARPSSTSSADAATGGYWLAASDGAVFGFDAPCFGSAAGLALTSPVVGMAATADDGGYWLVAADGGVFAYGDARFAGSMGAVHLTRPVVGMAADTATGGYWLVAADGGVFTFGAPFEGSAGALEAQLAGGGDGAPRPTTAGTGWWPPTAGSSPTATPASRGRWGRCT